MGAWGAGSFDNDDAQDFLGALASVTIDELKQKLIHAAGQEGYFDAPESSVAVAAAEVVATAKGAAPAMVPQQITEWVGKIEGTPSPEMADLARRAVERVRTNSELKDLWLEADGLNEWSAVLRDLEERLGH